jgi:hypothetical protein
MSKDTPVFNTAPLTGDVELTIVHDDTFEQFEHYRVTLDKAVPAHDPIIKIGESTVAKRGNLTGLSGETKTGKTAIKDILIAQSVGTTEFTEIQITPNPHGQAIISIDCEQDKEDQQYGLRMIQKRTGLPRLPEHLCCYNLLEMEMPAYKQKTRKLFQACFERFGGIQLAFIDGGTDYMLNGASDEAESVELLDYFRKLAIEFNTAIIIVVHLNENASRTGNDTMRGHFGKYLSRKAYGQLNVSKKNDISTMQVLRGRKAGADTPEISYRYSKEHGYHIPVNGEELRDEKREAKDRAKMEKYRASAFRVFGVLDVLRYTDAVEKIMKLETIKERAAKDRMSEYQAWGFIELGQDGLYRRCSSAV